MVTVSIEGSTAVFAVRGLHRLWAYKSQLTFPLAHVKDVRLAADGDVRGWWKSVRLLGTWLPGGLAAGTFYRNGKRYFCDLGGAPTGGTAGAVVVELTDERYDELIIDVLDAPGEVARFQAAPLG